jgi:flagellar protein FlbD
MIKLTRLNGTIYVLNCELIETLEATPDTVISTINGKKYICTEKVDGVIERIIEYKSKIQLFKNPYQG